MRIWNRFNRRSFLIAVIIAAGGYVAWNWVYPRKYRAYARLQVARQAPIVLFQTVEPQTEDNYKRYQKTQQILVKSQLALNAALQDKTVSKYRMVREQIDPIGWLQENLEVEFFPGSEVMEIALSGDDPVEIAGLVNAVKKAYMEEIVNMDVKRRLDRYEKLKKLKDNYGLLLKERRERLRKNAEALVDDPASMAERQQYALEFRRTVVSRLVNLQLEEAEAEALLARRKESVGSATDAIRKEIAQIEDRLADLKARQKLLQQRIAEVNQSISRDVPTLHSSEEITTEIAVSEDVYRKVTAEVEALNVELGAPPRIRTIEDAVPPPTRSRGSWGGSLAREGL